jgi:predicted lipoprotein with Yx(FWY)xxD motif
MIRTVIPTLAFAAALLAGCGGDERDGAEAASPPKAAPAAVTQARTTVAAPASKQTSAAKRGTTIKAVSSQFGKILADGRGQAVYVFDKETSLRPECYGACAKAWPPVLTKGRPVAGKGARRGLLGTTRRRNGRRQVTVDGQPLYYYVHDAPGRVLCHNVEEFSGLWLVVRPGGTPVR